jgi:hypothetical protein
MKTALLIVFCLFAGSFVVGCGRSAGDRENQATEIAAEIFASQTAVASAATHTPTVLPIPTDTELPTNTQAPDPTSTPQLDATATAAATSTPLPSLTPAPHQTPTPLPEPTQTAPAPTATTEAGDGPVLLYFRANVTEANPGDTVVLEWESSGATRAVLYHLLPGGQLPGSGWDVAPTGAYQYEITLDERNISQFYLIVLDQEDRYADGHVTVNLRCTESWFFSPAPDVCPTTPVVSDAAEQHFERGVMIWVEQEDRMYVLYGDDQFSPKWAVFTDEWDEGEPEDDPSLTPPGGLYQPVRGFGLVWREYPEVRERLGWATDQERGFGTVVQRTTLSKYNSTYIRAFDGNVWHLGPERASWEKIVVE